MSGAIPPLPLHACLRDVDSGNCTSVTDTTCSSYTKCPRELIPASLPGTLVPSKSTTNRNTLKRFRAALQCRQPENTRLTRAKSGRTRGDWCQPRRRYLQAKRRVGSTVSSATSNAIKLLHLHPRKTPRFTNCTTQNGEHAH